MTGMQASLVDGPTRAGSPCLRGAAPDVLATAGARWRDPAEVVRVLLEEEVEDREAATRRNHRKRADPPTGKAFDSLTRLSARSLSRRPGVPGDPGRGALSRRQRAGGRSGGRHR